jgi:hypothetical protein
MLALQAEDGLTSAKPDYDVRYLMDNCEVYWGLSAMARIEAALYRDREAADRYATAALRVRTAILSTLFNPQTGLFRIAKDGDGALLEANLAEWYPGTVALIWPQLFGVVSPQSAVAAAQWAALNASWNGIARGDWTTTLVDPDGFPWLSIGCAAAAGGDCSRARTQVETALRLKHLPTAAEPSFRWPFAVDDAGWLLQNLVELDQAS